MARSKLSSPQKAPLSQTAPRRSARIQGVAAAPTTPTEQKAVSADRARVTKTKPKSRAPQQRYDCTTCDRTLAASSFPKHLPTDTCTSHLINTCRSCLKQWIAVQVENTTYDNISCPECPEIMQNSDIELHAAKDVYKRFDELERRGIADKTLGWRWCLSPRCRAGQVHEAPAQAGEPLTQVAANQTGPKRRDMRRGKKKKSENDQPTPNICTCTKCGAKACVDCDRPWHEGETCEVYQKRLKNQNYEKEEAATLKTIEKACKACPNCKKNIQKNGGCDAMTCSQCKTRFCFLCLRTYTTIGRDGHGPGCTYSQPGRIDPHNLGPAPMFVGGAVALGIVGGVAAAFMG